jgi:hypothetical protein
MRTGGSLLGVGANKINGYTASGIWSMTNVQMEIGDYNFPKAPPVSGYIGWYTGDSFSGTTWTDLSGNANNASVSRGTVTKVTTTGNGARNSFTTLQGTTADGLLFPAAILPSTYTVFHVTRYTGGTRARIVTGTVNNWLSGHWSGTTGVAYHEGWLTGQPDNHRNYWVLSTDQVNLYRSNKVTRGTTGGTASTRLTVNAGQFAEYSDWQCAEIIVYNTALSGTDYAAVEEYLAKKYGFT